MTDVSPEATTITLFPPNEAERLAALHRYDILDTPPEEAFDRITQLAARLFQMPIVLVSLVDQSRAWFKSCLGFDAREVPREATLCSFAILVNDLLVIPDTRQDPRFACNPFVISEPGVRFYAGAPLLTHDGFNLGTLCLLDSVPHADLTADERTTLADLAAMVVDELELRAAAQKIAHTDAALLEVTQGVAAATGEAFFYSLVKHFTKALEVDYAFIGLLTNQPDHIQTLAVCNEGAIVDNFEYDLKDTPCVNVIKQRKICCHPRNVQQLFPDAPLLIPLGVESYVAVPVFDSTGNALGLLGVMAKKPLTNTQLAESLLSIFGVRIATELERQRAEEKRAQMLAREQQYSRQLRGLTKAALAMNSSLSVEEVLGVITEQAYKIVGAHQSVTSLTIDQNWAQAISSVYLSEKYAAWRDYDELPDGTGIYACVCHLNRPMRLTQAELEAHPKWRGFGEYIDKHPPMRGWLAAPLTGRDGHNIGLIQLSDKYEGEFTEEDESILVQLAQMASVAIENTRFYESEQRARTGAETANRIKDEFLAVLSHELRSPLNPILGWAKLLRTGKLSEQATRQALETIERNAKLQTQLIEDLLDVSRILQGKLSLTIAPVSLVTPIEAALETVRLAAEAKSIHIQTWLDPTVGTIQGDMSRLQQVIWNLLANAVKFTPTGGKVEVVLEQVDTHAQIRVTDTGIGINPDFLPYVFDSFRQEDSATTRKFGGLGLGLAIARHISELHGGSIQAASAGEGEGATFVLRLPLQKETALSPIGFTPATGSMSASGNAEGNAVPSTSPLLNHIRVLVVDDEADTRDFMVFLLQEAGAIVTAAPSATEALTILAKVSIDVLVSDIGMPHMDGYMFMRQLQAGVLSQSTNGNQATAIRSIPPAIALTAYARESDIQQATAVGFQKHMPKPVDPKALIATIRSLVSDRQAQPE